MRAVHPGEVLREDYLLPLNMSANALAQALRVTPARINEIVREKRGVTADTALRLARYFGGDAQAGLTCRRYTTLNWPSSKVVSKLAKTFHLMQLELRHDFSN